MPKKRVFVDTNVIFPAVKIGEWRRRWGDCIVSLERLLTETGSPPATLKRLEDHFREPWLSQVRTHFRLGLVT